MANKVKPVPEGYHTVTPILAVKDASRLLDFVKRAFDAKEVRVSRRPDGTIWHADIRIGDSHVMMAEATAPYDPMPTSIYVYVEDADATYQRALRAGATSVMEPANQFYGDRNGGVKDPVGNLWFIGTHIEDVPEDELTRREKAAAGQQHGKA